MSKIEVLQNYSIERSRVVFQYFKKQHVLRDNEVSIPPFLVTDKHIKVLETTVFSKTIVLL
jgi:hypothetical protein